MSERGSFVTEYIYCGACFEATKSVLLSDSKYLKGITIPHWSGSEGGEIQIIAGKIGGLYAGEELNTFEFLLIPQLADQLCHPMRIAVLAEAGERIFTILPAKALDPADAALQRRNGQERE